MLTLTPSGILPEADPIQPLPMPASPRKTAAQEAQTSAEEWNGPTRDPNTSGGAFPPNLSRLSCRAESKHRVASPPTADRLSNGWSHWHQAPLARAEGMVMGPGWWRASGFDHGWLGCSRGRASGSQRPRARSPLGEHALTLVIAIRERHSSSLSSLSVSRV